MVDADSTAMADAIANQLSGLYRELAEGRAYSEIAAVILTDAPASGRAELLYLFQCDSDDLTMVSTFRRSWETDAAGCRWLERYPLSNEILSSKRFGVELPYVKFATDGRQLRFGMRFGPLWYVSREGPLTGGRFNPAVLVDPCPIVE